MISAVIAPSGLYEWLRMPFGLNNVQQIYQRMVDNALYGYLTIGEQRRSSGREVSQPVDVFTHGEPDPHRKPSVLGRRSYIDDILIPAASWTSLHQKVNRLLEFCDQWNLSISLPKSVWGRSKDKYLGH
uniref:Reverse transcriptase domain-containing protein n=1 Tax=Peronospora matthiolae TaxID=2874970 RepID=A0AAV1UGK1_9STRA